MRRFAPAARWIAAALLVPFVAAALPAVVAHPAAAAPTAAGGAPPVVGDAAAQREASQTVMLISGDRVTYTTLADGRRTHTVLAAPRPGGRPAQFSGYSAGADYYVVPSDAGAGLATGVLDRELFNISALIRDGQATPDQPAGVIATGPIAAGDALPRTTTTTPAVRRTAVLPSIGATAMRPEPGQETAFWVALTGAAVAGLAGVARAAAGRVWLDRTVRVSLEQSVPQVGAPAAWERGLDGTGSTVAVLDSGIDPTHPDLAGRVAGSANFTSEPSIVDGHGHGTHVASIVAGSGAASGGLRKGVAPGARILVGKVIDASGTGPMSQIIAGMEWAAARGADVVSMSLSGEPTDGTDPGSLAVDALSARYGTLFVIATGNSYLDRAVGSPAAATAALSVGAVDKSDAMAPYTSRGPRLGDAAVKPELTAPGSDIVAARAAGTAMGAPVDGSYTAASGTSMATPHVAAAAAVLAGAHPDWPADRIKEALVSTAAPGDYSVFAGGAGRLDLGRAVTQQVYGPEAVDVGPGAGARDLLYHNDSDADVTLDLTVTGYGWDGRDLPTGAVAVSPARLHVPAGASATAVLTVDSAPGERGAYAGLITATGLGVNLRSPFSYYKSTASSELTVRMLDSAGAPADPGSLVWAAKLDGAVSTNDPFLQELSLGWTGADGSARILVANGLYDLYGLVTEYDIEVRRSTSATALEVPISGQTTAVLDSRAARKVDPVLPEATDLLMYQVGNLRGLHDGRMVSVGHMGGLEQWDWYRTPTPAPKTTWFESSEQWHLTSPLIALRANGRAIPVEYHPYWAGPALAAQGNQRLPLVNAGTGTPAELAAARGKAALVRVPVPDTEPYRASYAWNRTEQVRLDAIAAGVSALLTYVDIPGSWSMSVPSTGIVQLSLSHEDGQRLLGTLAEKPVRVDLSDGRLAGERSYQLHFRHEGGIPGTAPKVDRRQLVSFPASYHTDGPGITGHLAWTGFGRRMREGLGLTSPIRFPVSWTEYVGMPGDDLLWVRNVAQTGGFDSGAAWLWSGTRNVFPHPARLPAERWFASPNRTGATDPGPGYPVAMRCTNCREGNTFAAGAYRLDSDPRHQVLVSNAAGVDYRMFRDGVEIPRTGRTRFTLPDEPGRYRLDAVETQQGLADGLRALAPRASTSWTFGSAAPTATAPPTGYYCPIDQTPAGRCAAQPLLQLWYGMEPGLFNELRPGLRVYEVTVRAAGGVAAADRLRLWTSTDGGTAWRESVAVRVGAGRFLVLTVVPAADRTDGFLSLRAEASDRHGNAVTQTVERAFAIR